MSDRPSFLSVTTICSAVAVAAAAVVSLPSSTPLFLPSFRAVVLLLWAPLRRRRRPRCTRFITMPPCLRRPVAWQHRKTDWRSGGGRGRRRRRMQDSLCRLYVEQLTRDPINAREREFIDTILNSPLQRRLHATSLRGRSLK